MGTGDAGTFRVSGVLKLSERSGIFVCGEMVTGVVKVGQSILWPLHGDALTMPLQIRSIDFVDYSPGMVKR